MVKSQRKDPKVLQSTMTDVPLAGLITDAFSHMCAIGASVIVAEQTGRATAVGWKVAHMAPPVPVIAVECTAGEDAELIVAQAVQEHAKRHTEPDISWTHATLKGITISTARKEEVSLFAPRAKHPQDKSEWELIAQRRDEWMTGPRRENLSSADWKMIAGLGQRAWWRCIGKEKQPDSGASRWEMKTRNSGEEMIGQRMRPLADVVSHREVEKVADGLTGRGEIRDEHGKGKRKGKNGFLSASGFRPPGPTDNAQAWCALWGLTVFPVVQSASKVGYTPGAWPHRRRRNHPESMVLPVFDPSMRVSPALFRDLITSGALQDYAYGKDDRDRARLWLAEQGVRLIVRFTVHVDRSSNRPDRYIFPGKAERVTS